MKLRIQSNSIRMRLKQGEMASFARQGRVEGRLELGPSEVTNALGALIYSVQADDVETVSVRLTAGEICVLIPQADARKWAENNQVGIEARIQTAGSVLTVLVEKDFKCLHREASDEDRDSFPHPKA